MISRILLVLVLAQLAWAQPRPLTLLLPNLSVLTSFAHDYGDSIRSITYAGREYSYQEATKGVLNAAGWTERSDKLELGEAWAREIVLYGSTIVSEKLAPEFAPKAELLADGIFRFTAVTLSMRGREPGSTSTRYRVEISPQAELTLTSLSR